MEIVIKRGEEVDITVIDGEKVVGRLHYASDVIQGAQAKAIVQKAKLAIDDESELTKTGRKRRSLSPEARQAMADAQRRRWQKYRQDRQEVTDTPRKSRGRPRKQE